MTRSFPLPEQKFLDPPVFWLSFPFSHLPGNSRGNQVWFSKYPMLLPCCDVCNFFPSHSWQCLSPALPGSRSLLVLFQLFLICSLFSVLPIVAFLVTYCSFIRHLQKFNSSPKAKYKKNKKHPAHVMPDVSLC